MFCGSPHTHTHGRKRSKVQALGQKEEFLSSAGQTGPIQQKVKQWTRHNYGSLICCFIDAKRQVLTQLMTLVSTRSTHAWLWCLACFSVSITADCFRLKSSTRRKSARLGALEQAAGLRAADGQLDKLATAGGAALAFRSRFGLIWSLPLRNRETAGPPVIMISRLTKREGHICWL